MMGRKECDTEAVHCFVKLRMIPAANPYAYTDNDPVNFTDPLGLSKKGC